MGLFALLRNANTYRRISMRKKVIHSLLATVMSGVAAFGCFGMAACNGDKPEEEVHKHTYGSDWKSDATNHWHEATCEHTDLKDGLAAHEFDNDRDPDCNVCGYTREIAPETLSGKIYLVGDSTVCSFTDNYYMPRYGYGTQLYNYINCSEDQIVNLALSGRSSLSFLTEANYTTLQNSITEGDYLIIGFGHNDQKNEAARFTDPAPDHNTATSAKGPSFQYTLYENYVKLANEKKATPILCTPIVRYSADTDKYDAANGHITADGDYAGAIKTLGAATNTTVIDLTSITKADYISLGAEALNYHAHTSYNEADGVKTPTGEDTTHLNYFGAKTVAYELANALKATDCSLKNYVKANIAKPDKATDFPNAIKADFVKAAYTQFDPTAHEEQYLGSVAGQSWYKTVMGDVGGKDKIEKFSVTHADGKFTVSNGANNGKFAGASYGFAGAFIQIDANKNFTASATVKIVTKTTSANNQTGFGMMIRDDIYINTSDATIKSDCLMAGAVIDKGAIFSYTAGKMANPKNPVTVAEGSTYTVSISKTDNSFTVTFVDGENTYTQPYPDFDVYSVDNDYVYLCLFANRGITVEFSDVQFAITGDSQGA